MVLPELVKALFSLHNSSLVENDNETQQGGIRVEYWCHRDQHDYICFYYTYKQWLRMVSFIINNDSITIPYEVGMQQRDYAREALV